MFRIDPSIHPTMAKVPTLGQSELDLHRTIERVVRLGHVRHVERGRLMLSDGDIPIAPDAVVVHCAALAGYVEATMEDDDTLKNRLCPPSPFSNTPADWARQKVNEPLSWPCRAAPNSFSSTTGPAVPGPSPGKPVTPASGPAGSRSIVVLHRSSDPQAAAGGFRSRIVRNGP